MKEDRNGNRNSKDDRYKHRESFIFNPIFMLGMLGTCFVCGFGWIPYFLATVVFSGLVGCYVESKINRLDSVTREKAYQATGREQPGDAKELAALVKDANQTIGVFCPAVPVVSLLAGWYMSYKAHKLARVGCTETRQAGRTTLARGFAAEGRCVF